MHKVLIISFIGVLILFSCQEKRDTSKLSNNNLNESVNKTVTPHFDIIIAQIINEEIVFVDNINERITDWEVVINTNSTLNVSFYDFAIDQEDSKYYLVASDSITPASSKIRLVLDSGKFYEYKYPGATTNVQSTGGSVTCSGCTSTGPGSAGECEPKENEKGWYCTDCSEGTCIKTSIAQVGGIL